MGINGALSSAVSGLRAQSHALENISGNIANSQTTGYKRMETGFIDLIPDAAVGRQVPGAVLAHSRSTMDVRGDIITSATGTHIALNSGGFFVVAEKTGASDGQPVFGDANFYTRRGDFQINKDGMLVNGAGYYLKGLPINQATGNVSGSAPEVVQISNTQLPPKVTTTIDYQANLPLFPNTTGSGIAPNRGLIQPWNYSNPSPVPVSPFIDGIELPNAEVSLVSARAFGHYGLTGAEAASTILNDGDRLTTTIGGSTYNLWFDTDGVANSAVQWAATPGQNVGYAVLQFGLEDADLASLHANDDLYLGGTHIPFSSAGYAPTPSDLIHAIEAELGPGHYVMSTGFGLGGRRYYIQYPVGSPPAATTAAGTQITYQWYSPPPPATAATTTLTISEHDIVGLHRSTEPFVVGGVPINFSAPAYDATKQDLLAAITDAFAASAPLGTTVSPTIPATLPAGPLNVTISYNPPGFRAADTVVGGISTNIDATGDIDTMLAGMQAQLRDLTGDNTLFVKLKNGEITVSAGENDPSALNFVTMRNGVITGDILGLAPGPYTAIPGAMMTPDNTYADLIVNDSDRLVVTIGDEVLSFCFDTDGRQTPAEAEYEIDARGSLSDMLASLEDQLRLQGGWAAANATVGYGAGGIEISFPGNYYYDIHVSGSAADKLEIAGTHLAETGGLTTILATDADRFLSESVSGGATTAYAPNGAAADVQFRWAKVDGASVEGQDTWHLYYLADSNAVGDEPMWINVGQRYVFENGTLVPPGVDETTIHNLAINGIAIGDVKLRHNQSGISQFADESGTVSVSGLAQDGYGSGEFQSIAITDNGRVIAAYSNGEQIEVAQLVTAQFNSPKALKRLDGGVYQATAQSGEPIFDQAGSGIVGGALEASNTDISEEFTKLIITQQAYSAGTRMVSAADEMLQEALNMMR